MAKAPHTIRIISGTHRSRRLPVLDLKGLRPTGDRVRETLFNWLQLSIAGKDVLDLCAGAGALGFEADSRGAASVDMIEKNPRAFKALELIKQDFKFTNSKIYNQSAQMFLKQCNKMYDLIFLDPPFSDNLMQELSELSFKWVKTGGFLYREAGISQELNILPDNWELYRQKSMGQVKIELWRKISTKTSLIEES